MQEQPVSEIAAGIGGLLFGIVVLAAAAVGHRKALQSREWLQVQAEITDVYVDQDEGSYPRVQYRYHLEGKPYEGNRVGIFERGYNFHSSARAALSGYQVGQRITVWVNPANHSEAVLQPGLHAHAFKVALLVGVGLTAAGVYFLVAGLLHAAA